MTSQLQHLPIHASPRLGTAQPLERNNQEIKYIKSIRVQRRGIGVLYQSLDLPQLARFLNGWGYDAERPQQPGEYARLWHTGALVVIYTSGLVQLQHHANPSAALLNMLMLSAEREVLQ